ncbi:MAG TPA: dTDP-4-dehydrorhamnose 3,5-epimerase family protein [Acidimicrobiales bacterium]|nr:dTDP-4-dehydrorhamnose 3,5-epimerase family protein [Acidimicrobiales bacterium]
MQVRTTALADVLVFVPTLHRDHRGSFAHVRCPPSGLLHGFQVLSDVADVCYRIDREHDPSDDRAVRYDDPDLGILWPLPVADISPWDRAAGSWADLVEGMCR